MTFAVRFEATFPEGLLEFFQGRPEQPMPIRRSQAEIAFETNLLRANCMKPSRRNKLTNTSDSGELFPKRGDMTWMKRQKWANCCEPFCTELETLSSQWVEGALSNEELALELWEVWSKLRWSQVSEKPSPASALVEDRIAVLVESLLSATQHESATPEERMERLQHSLRELGSDRTGPYR